MGKKHSTMDCGKHAFECKYCQIVYAVEDIADQYFNTNSHTRGDCLQELQTKYKCTIIDYMNACNHFLEFHIDGINMRHLCTLNMGMEQCASLKRYCGDRRRYDINITASYFQKLSNIEERDAFNHIILMEQYDTMHYYLCHPANNKNIFNNNRNWRFIHQNTSDIIIGCDDDDEKQPQQETKCSFSNIQNYDLGIAKLHYTKDGVKQYYVGCKHPNFREEILIEFEMSMDQWHSLVAKGLFKMRTDAVKKIKSLDKKNKKSITLVRVLVVYLYTAHQKFQKQIVDISRKENGLNSVRKEMSTLGHSFSLLRDTVKKYGFKQSKYGHKVFRGIGVSNPGFKRFTFTAYAMTSTSTANSIAFSFGTGCVLELIIPVGSIYFDVRFISAHPLEKERIFFGSQSKLQLNAIYNNINMKNGIDIKPLVELEKIIDCKQDIMLTSSSSSSPNRSRKRLIKIFKKKRRNKKAEAVNNDKDDLKDDDETQIICDIINGNKAKNNNKVNFEYWAINKKDLCLQHPKLMWCLYGKPCDFDTMTINIDKLLQIFINLETITIKYEINVDEITSFCLKESKNKSAKMLKHILYYPLDKASISRMKEKINNKLISQQFEWMAHENKKEGFIEYTNADII